MSSPTPLAEVGVGLLDAAVAAMGGARREGQREMAAAVAQTLTDRAQLMVEAGTGTGKSLAYLAPALGHAVTTGERVIVSTATLALQRQVMGHDLPLLVEALADSLPRAPTVAVLKGWHHYACAHKLSGGFPREEPGLFSMAVDGPGAVGPASPDVSEPPARRETLSEQVLRAREWAQDSTSGDRDDLVPGVGERAWRQVSVTSLECLGRRCPMLAECAPEAARRAAAEADLVVTNHAMLGIAAAGSPGVLPEHGAVVVDEAHDLVSRLRAQATVELSAAIVESASRLARRHAGVVSEPLDACASVLRSTLGLVPEGRLAHGLADDLHAAVVLLGSGAREALAACKAEPGSPAGDSEAAGGLAMARGALLALAEVAERLLSEAVAERREVLWCERSSDGVSRLRLAPVEVAPLAAEHLWAGRSVVLTSATLQVGAAFDHVAIETGLDRRAARSLDVGSPFDHRRQGICYVAAHLPAPGASSPSVEALDELGSLVEAAGGRTLALFSSRRAAEAAAAAMRERLDVEVMCQGEDMIGTLLARFAESETSCLFGTLSLWQGVDVPGDACRLVVIDRIPFPRPDDPMSQARMEVAAARGANPFMTVAATHAALLIAQGAGRLLRRDSDRGVVAILDSRLVTARYGPYLSRSLPPMWRTTDAEVAHSALRRLCS